MGLNSWWYLEMESGKRERDSSLIPCLERCVTLALRKVWREQG